MPDDLQPDEAQAPAQLEAIEQAEDNEIIARDLIAEGLDDEALSELYDDTGASRFTLEDGTPCDQQGNPIPELRPGMEPVEEPVAVAPPVPPIADRPKPQAFRPAFASGLLSDSEQARLNELVDPEVAALFETMMTRAADRVVSTRDQQRMQARSLGIAPDFQEEVGARMSAVEHMLPMDMRGTRNGVNAALALAAIQEAGEDGDMLSVLRQWSTPTEAPRTVAPIKRVAPVLPPSAKTTVPRSAPEAARRGPVRDIGGLSPDEIAIMRSERKMIHGR